MVESVPAMQNPVLARINGNRGVPPRVAGHWHQNNAVSNDIERFGSGKTAPRLAAWRVLHQCGSVGPLHASVAHALAQRRRVHRAARLGRGDMHERVGKVGNATDVVEIEVGQHDVAHI